VSDGLDAAQAYTDQRFAAATSYTDQQVQFVRARWDWRWRMRLPVPSRFPVAWPRSGGKNVARVAVGIEF